MTGGDAQGAMNACLCKHFGGVKALFYYVNHKVSGSVGGGAKPCKYFYLYFCSYVWCTDHRVAM